MNRIKGLIAFQALLLAFSALALAPSALARDLQGRMGLGYNAQFANYRESGNSTPAIAAKYAPTKDIALEGVLGVATTKPGNSVVALKLFKNLFYENNLNFYGMLAGGLVTANSNSGVDLQGGFGCEFFIPGLESVGMSFELGGELTNITGSMVFRTVGASFLNAGMRFYF
ncbi:MAG: hypothetical protein H7301_07710 [Cryobacterium sp.]|nr:hypothetical protein [Oligoflexia bacterium]